MKSLQNCLQGVTFRYNPTQMKALIPNKIISPTSHWQCVTLGDPTMQINIHNIS